MGEMRNILIVKCEGNRPLGRPKEVWNIIRRWILLRIASTGGL
jgi:hypothetical protein